MKRTIREFKPCQLCEGSGILENSKEAPVQISQVCICNEGKFLIKETIEESDDMKEFIEKKCGWELVEVVKSHYDLLNPYCCTGCPCNKPRCMGLHSKTNN